MAAPSLRFARGTWGWVVCVEGAYPWSHEAWPVAACSWAGLPRPFPFSQMVRIAAALPDGR